MLRWKWPASQVRPGSQEVGGGLGQLERVCVKGWPGGCFAASLLSQEELGMGLGAGPGSPQYCCHRESWEGGALVGGEVQPLEITDARQH